MDVGKGRQKSLPNSLYFDNSNYIFGMFLKKQFPSLRTDMEFNTCSLRFSGSEWLFVPKTLQKVLGDAPDFVFNVWTRR